MRFINHFRAVNFDGRKVGVIYSTASHFIARSSSLANVHAVLAYASTDIGRHSVVGRSTDINSYEQGSEV